MRIEIKDQCGSAVGCIFIPLSLILDAASIIAFSYGYAKLGFCLTAAGAGCTLGGCYACYAFVRCTPKESTEEVTLSSSGAREPPPKLAATIPYTEAVPLITIPSEPNLPDEVIGPDLPKPISLKTIVMGLR